MPGTEYLNTAPAMPSVPNCGRFSLTNESLLDMFQPDVMDCSGTLQHIGGCNWPLVKWEQTKWGRRHIVT
jgi:hypothetical protein